MSEIREAFERRFAPFSASEAWFESISDAYERAFERDDEYTERKIQTDLMATARLRGITLPWATCGCCSKPRKELQYLGDQCRLCELRDRRDDARARRRRAEDRRRFLAMTPEQQAEHHRMMATIMNGLWSRDVQ